MNVSIRTVFNYNKDIIENKKYQIWLGYYHFGQGSEPPKEPEMVAEIEAPSFDIACFVYELKSKLSFINNKITKKEKIYKQNCSFDYYFDSNSHGWTGKYYETRDDALKSFDL